MSDDLEIGMVIQDNDPRMPNRRLQITGFSDGVWTAHGRTVKAVCAALVGGREFSIDVRRIYRDSKQRRSGFSVILPEPPTT